MEKEDKMLYWKKYIEANINKPIDVDLELLRFSIISVKGKSIKEYLTFNSKIELLNFLKEVVVPSITLSMFTEDSKEPSLYLWNKEEVLELVDNENGYFNNKISKLYKETMEYLENINEDLDKEDLKNIITELEKSFDVYNMTFLNLSYGETTDDYLKNLIESYKTLNILEVLEKDLKEVGLTVEKLRDVIENIYDYEHSIRENILDKLPLGD